MGAEPSPFWCVATIRESLASSHSFVADHLISLSTTPPPPLSRSAKPGPAGRRQKKAFGQGGGADGTAGGNASTGDGVILDDCRGRDTCARDGILRTVAAADLREIRSAVSRGKAHTVRVHFTFRSHTFAAALLLSTFICVIECAPSDCFY